MNDFSYLNQLITDCELAKNAQAQKVFLYEPTMQFTKGEYAVYIIKEIDGNPDVTFKKFLNFKQQHKNKKCPHPNTASNILYVGSSTTNLNKRLQEHTRKGSDTTYALRLYDWFNGQYEIEIRIYQNISSNILQLIEDNLAHVLKPAFGKKGSNNK